MDLETGFFLFFGWGCCVTGDQKTGKKNILSLIFSLNEIIFINKERRSVCMEFGQNWKFWNALDQRIQNWNADFDQTGLNSDQIFSGGCSVQSMIWTEYFRPKWIEFVEPTLELANERGWWDMMRTMWMGIGWNFTFHTLGWLGRGWNITHLYVLCHLLIPQLSRSKDLILWMDLIKSFSFDQFDR